MAEEETSKISIIEEREELMVDPTRSTPNQNPTKRIAHFLKPTLNPNSVSVPPQPPKIQSFSSSSKPNVSFLSHSTPLKGWTTWVRKLEGTHEPAWRKAGIFEAIKGSTYHIARVKELIYRLVERWCPETNTFVFPWGEVSITLEDVFVLGGFSPLGDYVFSGSSVGKDVEQVENGLINLHRKLSKGNSHVFQSMWQDYFMRYGNEELEYAGFLSFWLSRHVFLCKNHGIVTRAVFPLAARISCGAKLAFGPVVLASIYRDLSMLKREIVGGGGGGGGGVLYVWSPMQLVQVWAWERFPTLGPVPRMIKSGETRLTRWESFSRKLPGCIDDVEACLDDAGETFRWRPYGMSIENWSLPRFYVDWGTWVDVDSDDEWMLSIVRCLMGGQLMGLDNSVEGYNPHRVALQFGLDQDIPELVDRFENRIELGGVGYKNDGFKGLKVYLPHRLHEGDVTSRYIDWWSRRSLLTVEEAAKCQNLGNEIVQVMVESSEIPEIETPNECIPTLMDTPDEASCQHIDTYDSSIPPEIETPDECIPILIDTSDEESCQNVDTYDSNIPPEIETPNECITTLINTPDEASSQNIDTYDSNIPVTDDYEKNPFAARYAEYELRISRLKREILALPSSF